MAPARMVGFIEEHARTCDLCLNDPDLQEEIAKITELVLPESKIPKAVRQQKLKDKAEAAEEDEDIEESDDGDGESGSETDDGDNIDETTDEDEEMEVELEIDDPIAPPSEDI